MLNKYIKICHRCPIRQKPCNGSCICGINKLDITECQNCPLNKFKNDRIITKPIERKPCSGCGRRKLNVQFK
jgi:hypothetical protein